MKNLLNDPDVMALYKGLQNNKYEDIDDYLTSIPIFQRSPTSNFTQKQEDTEPKFKLFCNGKEVTDFDNDMDYGL